MLKHTSANAGGPANGQYRNNPAPVQRSIHLRPQQPLNISALSAAASQNSTASNINLLNGGQRIPTTNLLNIPSTPTAAANVLPTITAGRPATTPSTLTRAAPSTPITPISPITPLIPNGIANNLHTYTNQHIPANNNNHSNHNHNTNNNNHIISNNDIGQGQHGKGAMNPNQSQGRTQNHNQSHTHHNYSNYNNLTGTVLNQSVHGPRPREAFTSLGLLCLVSLLLALLSLIFLLKISPNARDSEQSRNPNEDFVIVYDATLALGALSLSLNLCCLLVCAIQFLFAVKLARSPMFDGRDNKYLEKSSASRTCAVGGFFISIPIFLTGIILYTFNHFHSTPAIITSILIGIGIVFCGCAMVHNVFVWQREKTISYRSPPLNISVIGPISPPPQFVNSFAHLNHHQPSTTFNQSTTQLNPTPITPVSPNHSQGSFNPLSNSLISSSFLMRPATATPPTPKPIPNGCITTIGREATGSVSPGMPNLDTSTSLHELSTLV